MSTHTHYEVLSLPQSKALTPQLVKTAYRRALLQHHPDKSRSGSVTSSNYSVDQITTAYQVLSVPKLRAEYDRELAVSVKSSAQSKDGGTGIFRTGVEVVDLDDLGYDEEGECWFRGCRCGDERGYLIKEGDLEEASGEGEVYAGCAGCSLWLKVLFGVVEEKDGEKK